MPFARRRSMQRSRARTRTTCRYEWSCPSWRSRPEDVLDPLEEAAFRRVDAIESEELLVELALLRRQSLRGDDPHVDVEVALPRAVERGEALTPQAHDRPGLRARVELDLLASAAEERDRERRPQCRLRHGDRDFHVEL